MIESGSCCAILADTIASEKRDVTIVTNSAFIAGYIRDKKNTNVILLGGAYQKDSQVMVRVPLGLLSGFSREYAYPRYQVPPKRTLYFQVRLSRRICLP